MLSILKDNSPRIVILNNKEFSVSNMLRLFKHVDILTFISELDKYFYNIYLCYFYVHKKKSTAVL